MFALRLSAHARADVGVSVVSFHEQMLGANSYLNRARTGADAVAGYRRLEDMRGWYVRLTVAQFDPVAGTTFDHLRAARVRIGTMDLRIASIALAQNLVVVTRNTRDFAQVPGLVIEDWTR